MSKRVHEWMRLSAQLCMCEHVYVCVYVRVNVRMYVWVCSWVSACESARVYARTANRSILTGKPWCLAQPEVKARAGSDANRN